MDSRDKQTLARQFRRAVILAGKDPELMALLLRVGQVRSGGRILESGLPDDPEGAAAAQSLLMRVSRRIQAEVGKGPRSKRGDLDMKVQRALESIADLRLSLSAEDTPGLVDSIADLEGRLRIAAGWGAEPAPRADKPVRVGHLARRYYLGKVED